MTFIEALIKYFPYIVIILFAVLGVPEKIIQARYKHDDHLTGFAGKFTKLCGLFTLPIFCGLLCSSSILTYIREADDTSSISDFSLVLIVLFVVLYAIMVVFNLSVVFLADLVPHNREIKLNILDIRVNFDRCCDFLKLSGILIPVLIDFIVHMTL